MDTAKSKREIEKKSIRVKIIDAINNSKKISYDELKQIHVEALKFIETLPQAERGKFYWESGFEMLEMLVG